MLSSAVIRSSTLNHAREPEVRTYASPTSSCSLMKPPPSRVNACSDCDNHRVIGVVRAARVVSQFGAGLHAAYQVSEHTGLVQGQDAIGLVWMSNRGYVAVLVIDVADLVGSERRPR